MKSLHFWGGVPMCRSGVVGGCGLIFSCAGGDCIKIPPLLLVSA